MVYNIRCAFLTLRKSSVDILSFICYAMSSLAVKDPSQLLPPTEVKGMKKLEKEKFSKTIVVPWFEIDERRVGGGMNVMKKYLLRLACFKPLRPAFELLEGEEVISEVQESVIVGSSKRLFLNPVLVGSLDDIEEEDREKLQKQSIPENLNFSKIIIGYDNWRADEILKAVLPEGNFTSYSIIGHIVHVNLRDHLLPYKDFIGEIFLDKVKGAKTVVNKTDIIDSTFRNFKMEVLCGIKQMVTRTKENGCIYDLDFSAVYWNPRLSTEHERIIEKLKTGDVLYDVFCGIGPFAVPAAKKKCQVFANDLNPQSYKWLNINIKLNKVQQFVRTFNKDGRMFIENDIKRDMVERLKKNKLKGNKMHISMNLPASAVTFLPAFCGLLHDIQESITEEKCPIVHVYCFVIGEGSDRLAQTLVEENLGCSLGKNLIETCFVRNVAPNKDMMRVSFNLPRDVLCKERDVIASCDTNEGNGEPCAKRICLSSDAISSVK